MVLNKMMRAFEFFSMAADQNHAVAAYEVGQMYLQGIGTKADSDKATSYFQKSCDLGEQQACNYLNKTH